MCMLLGTYVPVSNDSLLQTHAVTRLLERIQKSKNLGNSENPEKESQKEVDNVSEKAAEADELTGNGNGTGDIGGGNDCSGNINESEVAGENASLVNGNSNSESVYGDICESANQGLRGNGNESGNTNASTGNINESASLLNGNTDSGNQGQSEGGNKSKLQSGNGNESSETMPAPVRERHLVAKSDSGYSEVSTSQKSIEGPLKNALTKYFKICSFYL